MSNIVEDYLERIENEYTIYRDDLGLSVKWDQPNRFYYVAAGNQHSYPDISYAEMLNIPIETFHAILIAHGARFDLSNENLVFDERKNAQAGRDALAKYLYLEMLSWPEEKKPKIYRD